MKTKFKVREIQYECTSKRCGYKFTVHTDAPNEDELKKVRPETCSACGRKIRKLKTEEKK